MSDTSKPPQFEKAPELFVEKPQEKPDGLNPSLATPPQQPAPAVRTPAPVMAPRAVGATPAAPKPLDPIEQAKAEREARRQATIAAAAERQRELDAIRAAGRLERERDLAADAEAEAKAEAEKEALRIQLERDEAEHAAALRVTVDRLLAERAERVDREFAEAEARRLEAEKDTDPSMGPQTVLDPRGPLARAARGGMARHMRGNMDALAIALAAEVEKAA